MEDDALGAGGIQFQRLREVPGDGLSLAVLIGRQPDGLCAGGQLLQFGNGFLFIGRNLILWRETMLDIHAQLLFLQVADVSEARPHDKILP